MFFSLCQGGSGEVRETCNGPVEMELLYCRSGKIFKFLTITEVFNSSGVHLKFALFYVYL